MATQAQCAYCFECLSASFERRTPLSLAQVVGLWEEYQTSKDSSNGLATKAGAEDDEDEEKDPKERSASSSTSSSRQSRSGVPTPATSRSSLASISSSSSKVNTSKRQESPLFVTWNTSSPGSDYKSLRGCIGTFEPLELEHGLKSYALTSAFDDVRFSPIPSSLLPSLSAHVTLLTDFSAPTLDPLDWTLGKHGIRISFSHRSRRYGSTYLPDVAKEQGWTKEETLVSLMRKAGWNGSSATWRKAWTDGRGELIRYEGAVIGLEYAEWKAWRDWVDRRA